MTNPANPMHPPLVTGGCELAGAQILLLGGAGGIGAALADALCARGASTVVLASRRPGQAAARPQIVGEQVDVTDLASVQALARRLGGRDICAVINCAGVNGNRRLLATDALEHARREMEVNYFGLLHLATVFCPLLAARGGGTLMTVSSFLSHVNLPIMATYCASKAAAHSLTQALRAEWRTRGVRVCGVYPTAVDTGMSLDFQGPKVAPADLAREMVDALERGDEDLLPADAAHAYADFLRDPKALERALADALGS